MAKVSQAFSKVAFATETEMVILRGRVSTLETAVKTLEEQNELLRRQLAPLKDGAWIDG